MAGVYIHIPFCHSKCAYCDFYSLPWSARTASAGMAERFAACLEEEFHARIHELGGQAVRTLYIGGGTPSILHPDILSRAVEAVGLDTVEEFTLEVNPEDVSPQSAQSWRRIGIDRISMGVQSLADSELRAVGRRHTASQALAAVGILHEAGFHNISLDLIYGLPGQSAQSFAHSLRGVLDAGPTHLSAYLLSYESGTALTRRLDKGLLREADDDTVCAMYSLLCGMAASAGFEHYEISNFGLPGFHSRHNSAYWNLTPYLGLGPGAHSLGADGVRRYHTPDLRAYLDAPAEVEAESESEADRFNDLLIISLRRSKGLDLDMISARQAEAVLDRAKPFLADGMLARDDRHLYVPERHWLRTDAIVRDLME